MDEFQASDAAAPAAPAVQTTATSAAAWPVPVMPGYQADRLLGIGASAQVWLVRSDAGADPLAAKCFLPGSDDDGEAQSVQRMLTRELRILANYSHEHLLNLHSVLPLSPDWGGAWALLMDFAPGGSLADLVAARTRLSVGETVTVLSPLAQVLGYLHGQGVVHGDVSPGNVLFTAEGKPLLSDFGVGAMVGDSPRPWVGTDGFVSDGIVAGTTSTSALILDTAADVYALAAVGWFCLTGQAPAPGASRVPLALHVQGVPEELSAALEAGLQESAVLRPTALELGQAIYRSAPALPLDLSLAVHPSVLPELLTRRRLKDKPSGRFHRPGFMRMAGRRASGGIRGAGRSRPPIGVRGGIRGEGRPRRWSRRRGYGMRLTGGALAVLLALVAGVLLWPRSTPRPESEAVATADRTATAPTVDPLSGLAVPDAILKKLASQDPKQALAGLAWLRSYAFSAGETGMLEQVDVSGSTAMAADNSVAAQLKASKHTLSGLETRIITSRTLKAASDVTALVAATAMTSGFTEVDQRGVTVRSQPLPATQQLTFVLARESGYWQIAEVHAAAR